MDTINTCVHRLASRGMAEARETEGCRSPDEAKRNPGERGHERPAFRSAPCGLRFWLCRGRAILERDTRSLNQMKARFTQESNADVGRCGVAGQEGAPGNGKAIARPARLPGYVFLEGHQPA